MSCRTTWNHPSMCYVLNKYRNALAHDRLIQIRNINFGNRKCCAPRVIWNRISGFPSQRANPYTTGALWQGQFWTGRSWSNVVVVGVYYTQLSWRREKIPWVFNIVFYYIATVSPVTPLVKRDHVTRPYLLILTCNIIKVEDIVTAMDRSITLIQNTRRVNMN